MGDPISGNGQVKIASGQALSGIIDLGSAHFLTLYLPPAMTGTSFTFLGVCGSGNAETTDAAKAATFQAINDDTNSAVTVPFTQGTSVGIGPTKMAPLAGFRFIKLQSNANEGADRIIGIGLKA